MPVQVNELIIKATVSEGAAAGGGKATGGAAGSNNDAVVNECVEQVLEIIRKELKR